MLLRSIKAVQRFPIRNIIQVISLTLIRWLRSQIIIIHVLNTASPIMEIELKAFFNKTTKSNTMIPWIIKTTFFTGFNIQWMTILSHTKNNSYIQLMHINIPNCYYTLFYKHVLITEKTRAIGNYQIKKKKKLGKLQETYTITHIPRNPTNKSKNKAFLT